MNRPTTDAKVCDCPAPPKLGMPGNHAALWLVLLAALAGGGVLFLVNPAEHRVFPGCFFHAVTGLQCPGCGGTRALHQLMHGNLIAALHLNALLVISLPLIGWQVISVLAGRLRCAPKIPLLSANWLWVYLACSAVFSVLRNLPAFSWLSP